MRLLTPLLAILLVVPVGLKAQEVTSATFFGCQYDNDEGWSATYGTGQKISNAVWTVGRLTAGSFDAVEIDVIAVKKIGDFLIGVVGGPNIDWSGGENVAAYIVGGCGGLVGWQKTPLGIGIVAGAKFKFAFESGTYYKDGWQTGLWLTKGL